MLVVEDDWCDFNWMTVFLVKLENKDGPMALLYKFKSKEEDKK